MQSCDFFSSQLFGVIIGALLTGGFALLLDWLRSEREHTQHIRQKREELYIQILDVLMVYNMSKHNSLQKQTQEVLVTINKLQAHVGLYASKKVFNGYYKILDAIQDNKDKETIRLQIMDFTQKIKKELGIKHV